MEYISRGNVQAHTVTTTGVNLRFWRITLKAGSHLRQDNDKADSQLDGVDKFARMERIYWKAPFQNSTNRIRWSSAHALCKPRHKSVYRVKSCPVNTLMEKEQQGLRALVCCLSNNWSQYKLSVALACISVLKHLLSWIWQQNSGQYQAHCFHILLSNLGMEVFFP